jgi:hypothetical protein
MRFWIVALMIALLPLRGWVGDAMALERLAHTPEAPAVVAALAHDCHEAAVPEANPHAMHADGHGQAMAGDQGSHHSHLSCDLCNVPALHPPATQLAAETAPHALRVISQERFASSEPQRDRKPPIA